MWRVAAAFRRQAKARATRTLAWSPRCHPASRALAIGCVCPPCPVRSVTAAPSCMVACCHKFTTEEHPRRIGWGREGLLLRPGLSNQPSLFHGGDGRESVLGSRWSRAGCAQAAASECASCRKTLSLGMTVGQGRCCVGARGRQSCHSIVQAQQHKSWQLCPISFLADLTARS